MTDERSDILAELRRAIDGVDDELVSLFAKRFELVRHVAEFKKSRGLPAAIPSRVAQVVGRVRLEAEERGFPPDTAEKLWRLLIADMIAYEENHLQ